MAKPRSPVRQPKGEKISVGPQERAWFKKQREIRGLNQGQLATKVRASQGTISNLESGKHTQIKKQTYALLVQMFGRPAGIENSQQVVEDILNDLAHVPESNLAAVLQLVRALKVTPEAGGGDEQAGLDRDRARARKGTNQNDE